MTKAKYKDAEGCETVRIPIPDVNRTRTYLRNILGVILCCTDGGYEIGTQLGKLNQHYRLNQCTICNETFLNVPDVPNKEISLHECAKHSFVTGGQEYERCACKIEC